MDIYEWLQDKIDRSEIHPEYLKMYKWVEENYKRYLENQTNGETEKELDSGGNQEAGGIEGKPKRARRKNNPDKQVKRRSKKTREVRTKGEVGQDT